MYVVVVVCRLLCLAAVRCSFFMCFDVLELLLGVVAVCHNVLLLLYAGVCCSCFCCGRRMLHLSFGPRCCALLCFAWPCLLFDVNWLMCVVTCASLFVACGLLSLLCVVV